MTLPHFRQNVTYVVLPFNQATKCYVYPVESVEITEVNYLLAQHRDR